MSYHFSDLYEFVSGNSDENIKEWMVSYDFEFGENEKARCRIVLSDLMVKNGEITFVI